MVTVTRHTENAPVIYLVEAYRERGDQRAFERILALHDKLLNSIVRRYAASSDEPYEDLRQVGHVGLVKAVNGYEMGSKATFSSYAYSRIDGELRHHLRDTALMKKPRWARSLYSRISEATDRLTSERGCPPLIEEIAREVNVTPEGVVEVIKLFSDTSVCFLEEERGGGEEPDLSSIKSLTYESFSLPIEDRIALEQALESLTKLQGKVVYLFFYKDLSQTEIGRRLGLPQRKISDVIASSIKAMRNHHKTEGQGQDQDQGVEEVTLYGFWQSERGFSFLEVMITIGIMMVFLTIASSMWFDAVGSRQVGSATNQMVSELRKAHTNATNRLQSWQVDPKPPGEAINSYRTGPCAANPCTGAPLATDLLYLDECGADCPPKTMFSSPVGVRVVFRPDGGAQFFGTGGNTIQVAAADGSPCRQIQVNTVTSRVEVLPNACP